MELKRTQTAIILFSLFGGGLHCAQTAGESINYEASVGAALANGGTDTRRFTTAEGWEVELSEARVVFGPLTFYGGGQRAQLSPPRPDDRLRPSVRRVLRQGPGSR